VGFDPQFGARPLKRAIVHHVENPLAQRVLAGDFLPGDTVVVTRGDSGLAFDKRAAAASTAAADEADAQAVN
jgi:ATP-dependent Clp protease ATP-binding subunit ClpB